MGKKAWEVNTVMLLGNHNPEDLEREKKPVCLKNGKYSINESLGENLSLLKCIEEKSSQKDRD